MISIPLSSIPGWISGNRLRILLYHSISRNLADPHATTPEEFEQDMLHLVAREVEVVSLREGLRRVGEGISIRKCVVITFDDAYLDFLTHALPILERFGYPSTLFIPTGLVGKTARWDSYDKAKPIMGWEEIVEADRRGVSLSSHTVNHARLTECTPKGLEYEIRGSLDTLYTRCRNVFPALAYPGGYFGPREQEMVSRAGYHCALGGASRWGNGPETNFFALRRERMRH
jgi:peptidoglycan/xylan/chitin deacetylase (PgdA/CDA1 family)